MSKWEAWSRIVGDLTKSGHPGYALAAHCVLAVTVVMLGIGLVAVPLLLR